MTQFINTKQKTVVDYDTLKAHTAFKSINVQWPARATSVAVEAIIEKYNAPFVRVVETSRPEILPDEVAEKSGVDFETFKRIWTVRPKTKQEIREENIQQVQAALEASDKGMARVAEDVIGILIAKGLLTEDDLPKTVKDKLAERKALRKALK